MTKLTVEKVLNELPVTLSPSTIYFVKQGTRVVQYLSDESGTTAYPVTEGSEPFHPFFNS